MHEQTEHPDDRKHYGLERRVAVSLERPVQMHDRTWEPEWLEVCLRQRWNEDAPQINLSKGESHGMMLTLQEARDLGVALLYTAAEGGMKP
jgi:hypothetical protein